ncbi:MAG: hypothetical protein AB1Z98_12130 [Nannocystaceae bacterium]
MPESDPGVISEPEAGPGADSAIPEVQRPDAITEDTQDTGPTNEEVPPPAVVEPEPEPAVIDPSLLDAEPAADPLAPVATVPLGTGTAAGRSPEERDEAIEAAYESLYRPADNPARLNIAGRVMFANMSGRERVNGRMGGAALDVGPSWNRFGISGTLTGWGGRFQLAEETDAEMNAMLGGGLTLGLGRLALQSRGFIDLRLGYDVFYGVVNQRSDAPAVLQSQTNSTLVAVAADNLLPHGPRVRLDLGLLGAGNRRFQHGVGMSIGYQALLGSLNGGLPMTNMLTLGFSYWMG